MIRPLHYFLLMVASAALGGLLLPEFAFWLVPLILATFLGVGTWGSMSMRSGLWCRATWRAPSPRPQVALTYDDGPDPRSTPALLDLLDERQVKATFFCVGEKVREHPELVQRMHAAGHVLGNHSQAHSFWTNFYSTGRLEQELAACQQALQAVTGQAPRYFRPPFGYTNHATAPAAKALSLEVVGWQVRGFDTAGRPPQRVIDRVLKRVRPGGIVLLHDGDRSPEQVVAGTRGVLDGLQERGMRAVGLNELLGR